MYRRGHEREFHHAPVDHRSARPGDDDDDVVGSKAARLGGRLGDVFVELALVVVAKDRRGHDIHSLLRRFAQPHEVLDVAQSRQA